MDPHAAQTSKQMSPQKFNLEREAAHYNIMETITRTFIPSRQKMLQ